LKDGRRTGGASNDTLYGYCNDDVLTAGADNDRLYGHTGNDTLIGGEGKDTLASGEGYDSFVFNSPLNPRTNVDALPTSIPGLISCG
jgi:Ca2+-binding RTX toxin-like protein